MDFFRRQNWDLVDRSWIWFTLSGILLVAGIACWSIFGLNLGIDFTGGGMLRYEFARPIAADRGQQVQVLEQTRGALTKVNLGNAQVLVGGNNELIIRTPPVANDEAASLQAQTVREQIETLFGAQYGPVTALARESVGPIVGSQLRQSALHALLLGLFLILLYITIRYEFRFAVAAIVALLHDVFILVGAMAVLRLELDSSFVAVVLTVVGFSVHDTIIIFDRIRENMKLHRKSNFADTVNASLLQTMARSIYTVATVLLTLVALALFASGSIRVFSIAMIIGIILGAYSSIFNASQIVVVWERYRLSRRSASGGASTRRRERAVRVTSYGVETEVADGEEGEEGEEAAPAAKGARRLTASEAMARAEEVAQEEKREERRARRKAKEKDAKAGKSKKRF